MSQQPLGQLRGLQPHTPFLHSWPLGQAGALPQAPAPPPLQRSAAVRAHPAPRGPAPPPPPAAAASAGDRVARDARGADRAARAEARRGAGATLATAIGTRHAVANAL